MRIAAAVLDVGGVLCWTLLFLPLRAYTFQSLTPVFEHERRAMAMQSDVIPRLAGIRRRQERVALCWMRDTRCLTREVCNGRFHLGLGHHFVKKSVQFHSSRRWPRRVVPGHASLDYNSPF